MSETASGILLVVSGPSGVGKGTLITALRESNPNIELSVSCTTREPRAGEEDEKDYHFVSEAEFDRLRKSGQLLEWAQVHNQDSYGTLRQPAEEALAAGRTMVLEIDYQGAKSVREQLGERAVLVFVAPPSWQALIDRLAKRRTESAEALKVRLASARREIGNMEMYDYVILNDELGEAVAALRAILKAEQHAITWFDWQQLQQALLDQADEAAGEA